MTEEELKLDMLGLFLGNDTQDLVKFKSICRRILSGFEEKESRIKSLQNEKENILANSKTQVDDLNDIIKEKDAVIGHYEEQNQKVATHIRTVPTDANKTPFAYKRKADGEILILNPDGLTYSYLSDRVKFGEERCSKYRADSLSSDSSFIPF